MRKLMKSLALGAAAVAVAATSAMAQTKIQIIYSDTVPEADIRSATLKKEFGECLGADFEFKPYHGANLFKQGTELNAMQRGNLDMANLAIFDFQNQVPSTSLLGTPFLFRDYKHARAVYDGDILNPMLAEIEEKTKVKVVAFPYIGARHLGYKGKKKMMTPADLAGLKLRIPPGEGWQFVGTAMGATPVPVAFTETYTSLQTGAIDGQDNGFPAIRSMKFDELITHIGKTSHLIAANLFTISSSKWATLNPTQQGTLKKCAIGFQTALDKITLDLEASLEEDMKKKNIDVYMPDNAAFQAQTLKVYKESKFSAAWTPGLAEKIIAVGK